MLQHRHAHILRPIYYPFPHCGTCTLAPHFTRWYTGSI